MTTKLETLVLSTALITEQSTPYHLEVHTNGTGYNSFVMHGANQLFIEHHGSILGAHRAFYTKYAPAFLQEKTHGP